MKAVLIKEFGDADQLTFGEVPTPTPAYGEVLVRVAATALNRADLLQRQGKYPPPQGASEILGLEMAGTVASVGEGVSRWKEGDRVFGLLSGGGYAEFVSVHEDLLMAMPPALSFEEAAAIPEVFLTAFQALCWLGDLDEGQRVLIHAGASGVGTAAIQLVRTQKAIPYVTASKAKLDFCLALGAEAGFDYRTEAFLARLLEETEGAGADLIIDFIGAPYFEQNIEALARDGRIILLAMMGGAVVENVNLGRLFQKRAQLLTSTLRSRSQAYKINLTQDVEALLLPLFQQGLLKPIIDSVYGWEAVREAHRYMEANKNVGKIVLKVEA